MKNTEGDEYVFQDMHVHGNMAGIRWYSDMNPWLDMVVLVGTNYKDAAVSAMKQARDKYLSNGEDGNEFDELYECYGDAANAELMEAGIPYYITIYHDAADESVAYEKAWAGMLKDIGVDDWTVIPC